MSFRLSPGVDVREIDLTTIVPAVSTSIGAMGGVFSWGPVEKPILISNEEELVRVYARPTLDNFETWFVASSFLTYSNALYVSRALDDDPTKSLNAVAGPYGSEHVGVLIKNEDDFEIQLNEPEGSPDKIDYWAESNNAFFVARYPGELGNSLRVLVCDSADAFNSKIRVSGNTDFANSEIKMTFTRGQDNALVEISAANVDIAEDIAEILIGVGPNSDSNPKTTININDYLRVGNENLGFQFLQVENFLKDDLETQITFDDNTQTYNWSSNDTFDDNGGIKFRIKFKTRFYLAADNPLVLTATQDSTTSQIERYWEGFNIVSGAPGTSEYAQSINSQGDELHIVVVDEDGVFSNGVKNSIVEVFDRVSKIKEAVNTQGGSLYYPEVLRQTSRFIYTIIAEDPTSNATPTFTGISEKEGNLAPVSTNPFSVKFYGGLSEDKERNIPLSALARAYDVYKSPEDIDISIIITGKSVDGGGGAGFGTGLARYISDNIVNFRKDCVFTVSPQFNDVVRNPRDQTEDIINFRNDLDSTSYGIMDSGYKLMYDRYNDTTRYVPLCGDIAGLMSYTDEIRDPWFSPAGFNRGNIRNIIKLAYNPDRTDRDQLYKNGINPVVTFPGQGTVLYGDKTLLSRSSAFDRINVRRLFIVLEKAISRFAKFSLFEINDAITRASFRNAVEPYLRDIQGRRGIYDFKVICDETNNTGEVIDRNEFIGDIYIKPARSINFIRLNFIAVRTDVEFNEIVGEF